MMATRRDLPKLDPLSIEESMNRVIGSGPTFPFQFGPRGDVLSTSISYGTNKLNQSIHSILSTRKGERVFRPTFGSNLHLLIFDPNDDVLWERLQYEIVEALRIWEKRIRVTAVSPVPSEFLNDVQTLRRNGYTEDMINLLREESTIAILVQYIIYRNHQRGSYVFPFARETTPVSYAL